MRASPFSGRFLFTLALFFSLSATAANAGRIAKGCNEVRWMVGGKSGVAPPKLGDIPVFPWETLRTERAKKLWREIVGKKGDFAPDLHGNPNPRVLAQLPKGIPPELITAFHHLNRVMGDNVRFVKWMIALEEEIEDELKKLSGTGNSAAKQARRLQAIKAVIARRATAAGWSPDIIVYEGDAWRPMLRESKLFVDKGRKDETRSGNSHTAGAHLLQILYASEVLNAIPELRDSPTFRDKKPMQTLMQLMGDGYLVNGKPFQVDERLSWNEQSDPFDEKSLWANLFDSLRNGIASPETIGTFYHALPVLRDIEAWADEPANFTAPQ